MAVHGSLVEYRPVLYRVAVFDVIGLSIDARSVCKFVFGNVALNPLAAAFGSRLKTIGYIPAQSTERL